MNDERDETWLDLEKLAALIYSELEPACHVRHDVKLDGKLSEVRRQIDVLIEDEAVGSRVVVDCKDRARRVDINDATAFAGLLEDVGATAGVLLCNRGFSKAATTYAVKKGFSLVRLHDAESRKWNLDVLIPIVWMRLWLDDLRVSVRVWLDSGDPVRPDRFFRLLREGEEMDVARIFEEEWNNGRLHPGEPGEGTLTAEVDVELENGVIRPNAQVVLAYSVQGDARLGYVTPQQARGIFDEETGTFATAHFDVGETLDQEPAGGWRPIHNPKELAIHHAGTVVTLEETTGVSDVTIAGVDEIEGADENTKGFHWRRSEGGWVRPK